MKNREGEKIPEVTFHTRHNNSWKDVKTKEIFKDKTVIVFSLPGAFTPTCSTTHLPRYEELSPILKNNGVDTIYCLSVNDTFVMNAWAKEQGLNQVNVLPDGNGEFTEAMGMLVNKQDLGFGKRSWRYSMLVKNGTIDKMFIEPDLPGDPFEVSDADTMLNYISPESKVPEKATIFSKPGCSHCTRAKEAMEKANMPYEEIELGSHGLSLSTLRVVTGRQTTPQVYIEGQHIGGADELEQWLEK